MSLKHEKHNVFYTSTGQPMCCEMLVGVGQDNQIFFYKYLFSLQMPDNSLI